MQPEVPSDRLTKLAVRADARMTRRHVLRVGSLGAAGLSLPSLLWAVADEGRVGQASADACVILFLNGGPSHLDMWDLKPGAPDGIRGEFQPIASSVAGLMVSEHLPRMAQQMHRGTLIRSMHHGVNNAHAAAVYTSLTGHDRGEIGGGAQPSDNPSPGSVVSLLRPPGRPVPAHVTLPYITKEGAGGPPQPGFFGGYLGAAHDPLFVLRDPNAADFAVPELSLLADVSSQRLDRRRALFADLDRRFQAAQGQSPLDAMEGFQSRAFDLLTSTSTQQAFRLSAETDTTRERYGRNIYGQSVLLARRLIEAGTRLVTISWAPDANATWDTHGSNFQSLKTTLLPQFDAACASLVEDFAERGLLERTVVAVLGDFGRTPKINQNNAGRDHWNYCYSVWLCGGGFRQGYVHGASDRIGAFPAADATTPGELIATLYGALGIPADLELHDALGRPHRLVPSGERVAALLV